MLVDRSFKHRNQEKKQKKLFLRNAKNTTHKNDDNMLEHSRNKLKPTSAVILIIR